jgi:hypothetical protein
MSGLRLQRHLGDFIVLQLHLSCGIKPPQASPHLSCSPRDFTHHAHSLVEVSYSFTGLPKAYRPILSPFVMISSIASKLKPCLQSFNVLLSHLGLAAHETEVPQSAWQDELGRLRIWAANIGAHQTGQSSLDYRLRVASHISQQVLKLLEDLCSTLREIEEVLADGPSLGEDSDGEAETEIQQLYHGLCNINKCLYQMSMLIRKPARHDRRHQSHTNYTTAFQPFDRDHVAHKYPEADSSTVERLGLAISGRREDLRYRERHHAKLAQGLSHARNNEQTQTHSVVLSQTVATEFEENTHIEFEDTMSNSGLSQTSYALSLEGGGQTSVPPPPTE